MMERALANAAVFTSAQSDCAAFACPAAAENYMITILDASLLLASIIILLAVKSSSFRITAQQANVSP